MYHPQDHKVNRCAGEVIDKRLGAATHYSHSPPVLEMRHGKTAELATSRCVTACTVLLKCT